MRTIDRSRVVRKLGTLDSETALAVLNTLNKMFSK
ncbi:MAG: hypothetical protein EOP33_06650 [Rickettsiaceae bacterium]|nr:MAG: hypothetical protein EOP33_07310 [Rickettsiaceae bacterium]RYE05308.1 MAG: hypothetical protein EOP33_06650 [Rickettsiaceae bacterium]